MLVPVVALGLLALGVTSAAPRLAIAAGLAGPPLMQKDIIGMPGKEVRVVIVTSLPGASSPVHRHNAQVFVYMLSGKMTMQVSGSSPVSLEPGQTFYEGPTDIHSMSKNASASEPAQYLVFMIMDKTAPVSVPVP
jgi:quercetin dioxygenase-like cupin family protein